MNVIERVARLEERADSQDDVNAHLVKTLEKLDESVEVLNKSLNQSKGALKLLGWILALLGSLGGITAWLKS